MATVGAVWINVLPSMQGFATSLGRQATSAARVASAQPGRALGEGIADEAGRTLAGRSKTISDGFRRSTRTVTQGLSDFRAGFQSVDAAASAFTGRMGTLGGAASRGLRPAGAALSGVVAGFTDANAAASAFTGRAGQVGGVLRRGVQPAITGVRNLAAGFTDANAAASVFTGRLGTVGGVAGRALGPGVQALGQFRDGFTNAQAAASVFSGRMGTLGGATRTVFDGAITGAARFGGAITGAGSRAATALAGVGAAAAPALASVGSAATEAATRIHTRFSDAATQAGTTIRNTLGGAIGQVSALVGAVGFGALAAEVGRVANSAQTTEAQLTALYEAAGGGAAEVTAVMDGMNERFRGLDMTTMRQGAVSLAYMGLQGEEAVGVLERLDAATTATGSGAVGLNRALAALTKGVNAGKFQMVELNQISDAGIPIYDALADVLGTDIPTAQKMASDGAIGLEEVLQALSGDHGTWFPALLEGAENVADTFSGSWTTVKNSFVNGFAEQVVPLLDRTTPAMNKLGEAVQSGFSALPGAVSAAGQALESTGITASIGRIVDRVRDFGDAAAPAVKPFTDALKGGLVVSLGIAKTALDGVGAALQAVTGWMRENQGVVSLLGAVIGGMAAGLTVYATVVGIARAATLAWAAVQWVLNAALNANPIGIIIVAISALVAGIIWAYNNVDWFREGLLGAWDAIKTGALWLWDNGIKPVFDAIVSGAQWVGAAAMWLWTNAIKPAFDFIGAAAGFLFTLVATVLITPLYLAFQLLGAVVGWLWTNAIKPAWDAIAAGAMWLWNNALQPAWEGIKLGIQLLGDVFTWLWDTIISPVFTWIANKITVWWAVNKLIFAMVVSYVRDTLGPIFTWLWNTIIKPVWNGIRVAIAVAWSAIKVIWGAIRTYIIGPLATIFRWLWNNVIKPVWNGISSTISSVWNNGIKPAFNKVMDGVDWLKDAFSTAKDAIKKAWNGIRDSAKKPINFLIGTVYNNGIRKIWNKVAGIVDADKIKKVDKFSGGGVLPGYTPGRDVHMFVSPTGGALALSGGEAIMRPEVTRALGTAGVDRLNTAARTGGVSGVRDALGFAKGGVWGAPKHFAKGGWLGVNDINPSGSGIVKAAAKFIKDIAVDVFTGDLGSAVDKVFKPAREATKKFGTKGLPGTPYMMVGKFNKSLKTKIEEFADFFTGPGGVVTGAKGVPGKVVRLAAQAVGKYPESGGNNTNAITRWFGMNGQPWCAMFISWLFAKANASGSLGRAARTAWTGDYYTSGMRRVSEANRRPGDVAVYGTRHVNLVTGPNSRIGGNEGNNVQLSNRRGGTIFRPHWKTTSRSGPGGAEMATGGTITRGLLRNIASQDPHDRDTPIMRALYDRGGYIQPGLTSVINRSGRPEPVLTSAQWRDMHRIAESVSTGGGGLMRDAHVHLYESEATVREAFRSIDTELRKRRRGGVYAGRGA